MYYQNLNIYHSSAVSSSSTLLAAVLVRSLLHSLLPYHDRTWNMKAELQEQLHLHVEQDLEDRHPHLIKFNSSSEAGETSGGTGLINGGSASRVTFHIAVCRCALYTYSTKASVFGGRAFKSGAEFYFGLYILDNQTVYLNDVMSLDPSDPYQTATNRVHSGITSTICMCRLPSVLSSFPDDNTFTTVTSPIPHI